MATVARMSKAGVAVAQPYRGRSRAVRPRSYTATVPRGSGGRAARLAVRRRVTGAEGEGQGSTNKTTAGGEEEEEKEEEGEDEKEAADLEAEFEEVKPAPQSQAQGRFSLELPGSLRAASGQDGRAVPCEHRHAPRRGGT